MNLGIFIFSDIDRFAEITAAQTRGVIPLDGGPGLSAASILPAAALVFVVAAIVAVRVLNRRDDDRG